MPGFGAEVSLPLTQSAPAWPHDTTRLRWFVVTKWECHINTDTFWDIFFIFYHFIIPFVWRWKSEINQVCGRWIDNETLAFYHDRKYICYSTISETLFLQIFIFPLFCRRAQSIYFTKGIVNSTTKTFRLTADMTIFGHWAVNVISVRIQGHHYIRVISK